MARLSRALAATAVVVGVLLASGSQFSPAHAQSLSAPSSPTGGANLTEPVTLASKGGVLEIVLTPHQGQVRLDTVATPVQNFLVFAYKVIRGTASNGQMSGDNLYPAPTLQVFPGETLIVHVNNALQGLSIRDFYDPAYTPKGQKVALYPQQMNDSPFNLHVHGVHVSPKGNSDNVLLDIPAGMSNTYIYHIPTDMPQGAYWYHSHLHTVTTAQTYYGLAGLLEIGRIDGNIPVVTQKHIPIRNMILQYNDVFDRAGGLSQIVNPNWQQYVSTLTSPTGTQLTDGTYQPLLTPVDFPQSKQSTRYVTVWYSGPLSIENYRGLFQFIPSNLQNFTAADSQTNANLPANPALPDYQRDVQFTVNGQFEPIVRSKPGQTEIWVLSNISDIAYMNVELTETATGYHPKIAIVGEDGNPYPAVHYPPTQDGTQLLIPPASRFAIAVTMPATGNLALSMPPMGNGAKVKSGPGIMYTNNGTPNPPAVLGSISVLPSAMSYIDGFFVFPTQTLLTAEPASGQGETTAFVEGQPLNAYTSFVDISKVKPDVTRKILIDGGFLNNYANPNDPKAFVYAFDSNAFPYIPLIQPRLNSVEEWDFINHNNDEHPIHVHVNDFQVTRYYDPTIGLTTGPNMFGADNANVPAPAMGPHEAVIAPGELAMRTKFVEYTGLYVLHCHRLNHEDNGLMALINVIPAVSTYAVAVHGSHGHPAKVKVYDGNGDRLVATVTPFPDYEGSLNVAMGDIEGNGVLDLVVGAGKGASPDVVVYSGSAKDGKPAFQTEVARFRAFPADERNGVTVAAAQIDGTTTDNIIVGTGAGVQDRVDVFSSQLPAVGTAPAVFTSFTPYVNDKSGVSVAAGMVDAMSGRYSIVTAPGAGTATNVKVFRISLLSPIADASQDSLTIPDSAKKPVVTAQFMPFGENYKGGASLSTGWVTGGLGGAESIIVGQLTGGGSVRIYSAGSALQGAPRIYLRSPQMHDSNIWFYPVALFNPLGSQSGVHVASTSTTNGADLLVSGAAPDGSGVELVKYRIVRAAPKSTTLKAERLDRIESASSSQSESLGGN